MGCDLSLDAFPVGPVDSVVNRSKPRILCLGNVVVDILVRPVDRLPPKGGLSLVSDLTTALGGCASNTAAALGRMGAAISLLARVGKDPLGDFAVGELRAAGVGISHVLLSPGHPTAATAVLIDSRAQRSFLHSVAANAELSASDVRPSRFRGFHHLHVGGYFLFPGLEGAPMGRVLKAARARGLSTSLDTAWDFEGRWMKALAPCLPHLDHFLPSEREVKALLGHARLRDAAGAFLRRGVGCVVIKRGEKGAYLRHRDGWEAYRPARKVRAVDTTGAGDCFCAGYLKGLTEGRPLTECLALGCAAGTLAVQALGATTGIRSWGQVRHLVRRASP
jgi:sugar/nucleoside kinase (ribokinase family)